MNGDGYGRVLLLVMGAHPREEYKISSDNLFDKMILFLALFQCIPNN